jgi:hypothetical protein
MCSSGKRQAQADLHMSHLLLPPASVLHPQVIDRVLVQSGSQKWWAALIGRGKMQRAWNQHTAMTIVSNVGMSV